MGPYRVVKVSDVIWEAGQWMTREGSPFQCYRHKIAGMGKKRLRLKRDRGETVQSEQEGVALDGDKFKLQHCRPGEKTCCQRDKKRGARIPPSTRCCRSSQTSKGTPTAHWAERQIVLKKKKRF